MAATAPQAITDLSGYAIARTTLSLTWTAPYNGGSAITGYNVYSGSSLLSGLTTPAVSFSGTSATLSNCVVGQPYKLTVRAVNAIGTAAASNTVTAMTGVPATLPSTPIIWFDAADASTITATGTTLTNWSSKGSRASTNYTSSANVTTNVATIASKNAIRNPTNATMTLWTTGLGNNATILTAWNVTAFPADSFITSMNTWDTDHMNYTISKNNFGTPTMATSRVGGSGITSAVIADPLGAPSIIAQVTSSTAANNLAKVNGTSYSLSTSSAASGISTGSVAYFSKGTNPPWDTTSYDMGELVVYDSALTAAQVEQAEGYLAWKWGTQALLPSTHAYRTAAVLPSVPQNVSISTSGTTSATLNWSAPSYAGLAPVTNYTVTVKQGGSTINTYNTATSTSITLTGGTAGTVYTFDVAAHNIYGSSSAVSVTNAPSAPQNVTVTMGSLSAILSWSAPSSNGGSDLIKYSIRMTKDAVSQPITDVSVNLTTYTFTGLTNGSTYTFSITATNNTAEGTSAGTTPGSIVAYKNIMYPLRPVVTDLSCSLWYDAAELSTITTSGSNVTAWADKSGAGNNGTGYNAPTLNTASLNSLSYIGLRGSSDATLDYIISPGATFNFDKLTLFILAYLPSGTNNGPGKHGIISLDTPGYFGYGIGINESGVDFELESNNAFTRTSVAKVTNKWVILSATYNRTAGSTATFAVNGTPYTISGIGTSAPDNTNGFKIGIWNSDYASNTVMDVAEACVFTRDLSTVERQKVEGYMAWKWGIQADLSSGHPYRSANVVPTVSSLTATPASSTSVTLSWNGSAPYDNITSYTVTSTPSGGATTTYNITGLSVASETGRTYTVTGLTAGTSYMFTVTATTMYGTSDAATASATPISTPGAPTSLAASTNTTTGVITLTWTAPANNGSAITSYRVYSSDSLLSGVTTPSVSITGTTATISNATMGTTYSFKVSAVNANGEGDKSAALSVTPARVPDAPTAPTAVAGNKQATVSWTTPATGGSAITNYRITSNPSGITKDVSGNQTSGIITGLTNGTSYTFTVTATNALGAGSPSPASNSVTPDAPPAGAVVVIGTTTVGQTLTTNAVTDISDADSVSTVTYQWRVADTSGGTYTDISGATSATYTVIAAHVGKYYKVKITYTDGANITYSDASLYPGLLSAARGPVLARVPYAPTIGTATAGVTSARVTWTAPADNGGAAITSYVITSSPGGITATTSSGSDLSGTVTGLTAGTSYTFTVQAVNSVGTGDSSAASNSVTPYTTPGAPQSVTATAGSSQVALTWSAPASDGYNTITEYRITDGSGATTDVSANVTSRTFTGLTPGATYSYTVTAKNAAGYGTASAAVTATPYTTPGVPQSVTATASYSSGSRITVSWSAPASDGYNTITEYRITDNSGATTDVSANVTSRVFTGLVAARAYSYTVAAKNAAGYGTASSAASATAFGLPGTPVISTVTAGNTQATVTWSAVDANGSAITNYRVAASPGGAYTDTSGTSAVVTGLTNGTAYTFTVTATNAAGDSVSAASSPAVTPNVVPNAPTAVSASAGKLNATVSWSAPVSNGGTAVLGYKIYRASDSSLLATVSASPTTITDLSANVSYAFYVVAYNAAGDGAASSTSNSVTPYTNPGAPTISGTPTVGNAQATVSWTAAAANSSAITNYRITSSPDGITKDVSGDQTSGTITGLTNGTAYTFTVTATNAAGDGPASDPSSPAVTPYTVPSKPVIVSATAGNKQATVVWSSDVSANGSAIQYYRVTASPGGLYKDVSDGVYSAVVAGLTNGTNYTFTVKAHNAAGDSADSDASESVKPDAPPTGTITIVDRDAGLPGNAFGVGHTLATSNGISDEDGFSGAFTYQWQIADASSGAFTNIADASGENYIILAAQIGKFFRVLATYTDQANITYTNIASAVAGPAVSTVPYAPTIGTATADICSAVVTWTAPANNGGSAITGYKIISNPGGITQSISGGAVTSGTISGLTPNVSYTFTVKAVNANGDGIASASSNAVTPYTVPNAPTSVSATAGQLSASVAWTAPSANSSTITYYTVKAYLNGARASSSDVSGAASPITVSNLTKGGHYTFKVSATNAAGEGPDSATESNEVIPYDVPETPTLNEVYPGNKAASMRFTAPYPNIVPIEHYKIVATVVDTSEQVIAIVSPPAENGVTLDISGLRNGVAYAFYIQAKNVAGYSAASNTISKETDGVTPLIMNALPAENVTIVLASTGISAEIYYVGQTLTADLVTNPSLLTDGDGISSEITYQWCTVDDTYYPALYYYDISDASGTTFTLTRAEKDKVIGLKLSYTDGVGLSEVVTVANYTNYISSTMPSAPASFSVSSSLGALEVSWSAPTQDGGEDIEGYRVYANGAQVRDVSAATTSVTLGLADGLVVGDSYAITVVAYNMNGDGTATGSESAVFFDAPAPIITKAYSVYNASNDPPRGEMYVAWDISDISNLFTRYEIYDASTNAHVKTVGSFGGSESGKTEKITELSGGVTYTFKMRSVITYNSDEYTGSFSGVSESALMIDRAGPPTALSLSGGDGSITATWAAPAYLGGGTVTGYYVSYSNYTNTGAGLTVTSDVSSHTFSVANGDKYVVSVYAITSYSRRTYDSETGELSTAPESINGQTATTASYVNTVPNAPHSVSATPGVASASVSWSDSNNGAAADVSSYVIHIYYGASESTQEVPVSGGTSYTVPGLTNGVSYTFAVAAKNVTGVSSLSAASDAVVPRDVPSAPSGITGTPVVENGGQAVSVTWTTPVPNNGAAITRYYVTAVDATSGAAVTDTSGAAPPITVSGLTNGTAYKFRVAAENVAGIGPSGESAAVTPYTYPGTVTDLAAADNLNKVTLSWTVPAANGSAITAFKVYYADISSTVSGTFAEGADVSTNIILDASSGLYSFTVRAVNAAGLGAASAAVTGQSYGTPDAPGNFACDISDSKNRLTWSAPVYTGYRDIDHYLLQATATGVDVSFNISANETSYVHAGLTPGLTYTYYIRTVSVDGVVSTQAGPVTGTPYTTPGVPTGVSATSSDGSVSVSWSAPADLGGADLSGYNVRLMDQNGSETTVYTVGSGLSVDISGLTNGYSYTAQVATRNVYLTSAYSEATSAVVPSRVATAPTNVQATAKSHAVDLTWSAPADDGGAAIEGYYIYDLSYSTSEPVKTTVGTATSAEVTDLSNGRYYTFAVSAYNLRGEGALSASSNSVYTNASLQGSIEISGNFEQGQTLNVISTVTDADGLGAFSYQWASSSNGSSFADISGAIDETFTLSQDHVGKYIRVTVSYTDGAGTHEMTTSAAVGPVSNVNDAGSGVAITGTATYQQILTVDTTNLSDPDGLPTPLTLSYQWYKSADETTDIAITGASGETLTIGRNEVTYKIRVGVSYTDALGGENTVYSAYTDAVPAVAPTAPVLSGVRGDESAALSWSAPEWDGGSTLVSYKIYQDGNLLVTRSLLDGTSYTVIGLTNGQSYSYTIKAVNDAGLSSDDSNSVTVTPGTAPSAVRDLSGTYASQQVTLTWLAPDSSGGYAISGYNVYTDGAYQTTVTGTNATINSLQNGTEYTFGVAAYNDVSEGPISTVAITPSTVPGTPASVSVEAIYTSGPAARVSWSAPVSDGGAAISGYKVRLAGSSTVYANLAADVSSTVIEGLTATQTYRFVVFAVNKNGESATAADPGSDITAFGLPGAPTGLTLTPGNGTMAISWTAAAANGESVDQYKVAYGVSSEIVASGTSTTISGLTNGTTYTFTVTAFNAAGEGPGVSGQEYPSTVPGAPQSLVATHGDGRVDLSWNAPASNGGAVIQSYTVTAWATSAPGATTTIMGIVGTTISISDLSGVALVNGTSYTFKVAAVNRSGTGTASSTVSATPRTVPSAPQNFAVTGYGATSVSFSWSAPASNGGAAIDAYYLYIDGVLSVSNISSSATTYTKTGLAAGTTYAFTLRAHNSEGVSVAAGPVSEKPSAAPSTPSTLAAITPETAFSNNYAAYENGARIYNSGANYFGPTSGTNTPVYTTSAQWNIAGLIMNGTTNRNSTGRSTDKSSSNATTWSNSGGGKRYVIVDLGAERTFNKAYGYQTFSDGRTTHLGMAYAPAGVSYTASDSRLTYSSASWITIFSDKLMTDATSGYNLEQIFSPVTTRYIRVDAANDGRYGQNGYIEIYNVKVFYDALAVDPTVTDSKAVLTWSAPSDNGDAISKYTLTWSASGVQVGGPIDLSGTATTYTITGLTNGTTYTVSLTATNRDGTSTATTLTVNPGRVPSAPTDLTVTGNGNGYVDLSWNDADTGAGRTLTGYTVYTYTDASMNTLLKSTSPSPATTKSVRVTGLTNGTRYYFVVKGQNSIGYSATSSQVTDIPVSVPNAPTITFPSHTGSTITVSWTSYTNTSGLSITGYKLYRDSSLIADLSANVTSYVDTGLTLGTTYSYYLQATNSLGSTNSATATEYPSTAPGAPAAPTIIGREDGGLRVFWYVADTSNNGAPITRYDVYVSTSQNTGYNPILTQVSVTSETSFSRLIAGLTNGTTYYFKLLAYNRDGTSSLGAASAPEYPSKIPATPTGLTELSHGNGTITLGWNASTGSGDAVTYWVYKSLSALANSFIDVDWSGSATSYTSTGLTNGTTYYYKVLARNRDGPSALSGALSAYPSMKPDVPAAPTITGYTINTISLSWNAVANNGAAITQYRVYRATSLNGAYELIYASLGFSHTDTGLTAGTTYYYKMTAMNRDGMTSLSDATAASEKPSAAPGTPVGSAVTGLTVTGHGNGTISMSWNASTANGDAVTYYVYKSLTNSSFVDVDWSGSATSYTSSGLTNGTRYYYAVKAKNRDGFSSISSSVNEYPSTVPAAPVARISDFGNGYIEVSWTAPAANGADISGYKVWDASTNTLLTTTNASTLSFMHTGLTVGVTRYYYVTAHNRDGSSPNSNTVEETPSRAPGKPVNLAIQRSAGQFVLTWDVSDNGDAIIATEVYNMNTGLQITTGITISGDSATITGLMIGPEYSFKVRVQNRIGYSPLSDASAKVEMLTYPGTPEDVLAIKGDGLVQLTWSTMMMSTGGTIVSNISYRVYSADGLTQYTIQSANKDGCTVTGLTNGVSYSFVVKAYNGVAESVNGSAPTAAVTPGAPAVATVGETFVKVDAVTNTTFLGGVVAPEPSAPTTVTYVPPRPDVYPTVSISNIPAENNITRLVIATSPPVVVPNTVNKSVIIDVKMFSGETPVSTLSAPVTLLINIPSMTAATVNLYHRATENDAFTFFATATKVMDNFYSFETTHFSQYQVVEQNPIPCIVEGTRVLTQDGYKAVETLKRSDRIVTSEGKAVQFLMLRTTIAKTTEANAPYMIPAHCFGRNSPPAPVTLSGHHAIQIRRGVWHFPAALAKIYSGIKQVGLGESVTYYHIKLPNYLSDNLVVEGGAVLESLGGKKYSDIRKIYNYSLRLGGYTRVSASQFDKIQHA